MKREYYTASIADFLSDDPDAYTAEQNHLDRRN